MRSCAPSRALARVRALWRARFGKPANVLTTPKSNLLCSALSGVPVSAISRETHIVTGTCALERLVGWWPRSFRQEERGEASLPVHQTDAAVALAGRAPGGGEDSPSVSFSCVLLRTEGTWPAAGGCLSRRRAARPARAGRSVALTAPSARRETHISTSFPPRLNAPQAEAAREAGFPKLVAALLEGHAPTLRKASPPHPAPYSPFPPRLSSPPPSPAALLSTRLSG